MKTVWWIDHLGLGGTQRVLVELVLGLSGTNHKHVIICLNDVVDPWLADKLSDLQIVVIVVGKKGILTGFGVIKLLKFLRQESFDTSITLLFYSDLIGTILSNLAKVPNLISCQQSSNRHYKSWQCIALRRVLSLTNSIVINSKTYRQYVYKRYIPIGKDLTVIENGVNPKYFEKGYKNDQHRSKLCLPKGVKLIGVVGRLSYEKGLDILLNALTLIKQEDVHLVISGDGPETKNLIKQARKLKVSHRTHFIGYQNEIKPIYEMIDIYVQPSRFEGMPMSILEAMAVGCPVVASQIDGNSELVTDGVTGWLVPPEDPGSLAKVIQAALSNPTEAMGRSDRARELVSKQYSIMKIIEKWEKLVKLN